MENIPLLHRRGQAAAVTLLPGTLLVVDRIFIRKDSSFYNSVTFKGEVEHRGVKHRVRFWVSLHDANNIEYKVE
jgi:hypothetical protein